jgi:pilus assembly protein CpaF
VRAQVASAVDIVVHMSRLRDGRRVVFQITSVDGVGEDGDPVVTELFGFRPRLGPDGAFVATGVVPTVGRSLAEHGHETAPTLFTPGVDVVEADRGRP